MDPGLAYYEEVLNPYCAVYMKEAVETGKILLQNTLYSMWEYSPMQV